MSAGAATSGGHWLADALLRHWGTKAIALVLALVVFVMTRDEVTRTFRVPLEVQRDPDRVLLTRLPDTVQVEVRGPWARMAKLRPGDLGGASIELAEAQPGPLKLDPAVIVMPEGVVLSDLVYEAVDLRFEDIIERRLTVVASLVGEVHADYERVSHVVRPDRWVVRGPASILEPLTELQTETVSIAGATQDLQERAALIRPEPGVLFVGSINGRREPVVEVEVQVRPRRGERSLEISTRASIQAELDATLEGIVVADLPKVEQVRVSGPLPALRAIEELEAPLRVDVRLQKVQRPRGRRVGTGSAEAELKMVWDETVPAAIRRELSVSPEVMRLDLRLSPATP